MSIPIRGEQRSPITRCHHLHQPGNHVLGHGGAILTRNGSAILARNQFSDNRSDGVDTIPGVGGAIFDAGGKLISQGNQFMQNHAIWGGGIGIGNYSYADTIADVQIAGDTFSQNEAQIGGGLYNDYGLVTISNNTSFNANQAVNGPGGGLYTTGSNSHMTIETSTFTENQATAQGGAIYSYDTPVTVATSTITHNSSGTGGSVHQEVEPPLQLIASAVQTSHKAVIVPARSPPMPSRWTATGRVPDAQRCSLLMISKPGI